MTPAVWHTTGEAEHALRGLTGPSVLATHFHAGAVVVTAETATGDVSLLTAADSHTVAGGVADGVANGAADADLVALLGLHRDRRAGRLFRFPGVDALTGVLSVGALVADSGIDDVVMVGHREPLDADALVDTQDFVRPLFVQGRTVLVVRPAQDGLVVPFEQPDPTPCCADH